MVPSAFKGVLAKPKQIVDILIKRNFGWTSYCIQNVWFNSKYTKLCCGRMLQVFQGLLRAHKDFHDTKPAMTRLWIHECFRVFFDRLINENDKEAFIQMISEKLGLLFDQTFHNICPNKQPPIFGDYIHPDNVYEDIHDIAKLKKHMSDTLDEYNNTPGVVQQNLVLFRDAIEHGILEHCQIRKAFTYLPCADINTCIG